VEIGYIILYVLEVAVLYYIHYRNSPLIVVELFYVLLKGIMVVKILSCKIINKINILSYNLIF